MEEKKKRGAFFSRGIKAVVIALFFVSVFVFAMAVLLLARLFQSGMEWKYLGKGNMVSYEETNGCGRAVVSYLNWLPNLIESGKTFGYDGELNAETTVDITDFSLEVKKQNENTSYTVESLQGMVSGSYSEELRTIIGQATDDSCLEEFTETQGLPVMGESGYEDTTEAETAGDSTGDAGDSAEVVATEDEVDQDTHGESDKDGTSSTNWNYSTQFLFLYEYGKDLESRSWFPVSGISLADYARNNPENVSLLQLYKDLLLACDRMESFQEASYNMDVATNVMYYVKNKDGGAVYTNVSEWEDGFDPGIIGEAQQPLYLRVQRSNGRLDRMKDLTDAEQYVYNYLSNIYVSSPNEEVVITIDSTYPESDTLQLDSYYFEQYSTWGDVLIICLILSAVIALLTLIMSGIQAGRLMGDNELHNGFSYKLPTEVVLAFLILDPILMAGFGINYLYMGYADLFGAALIVLGELAMAGIFLWAYLELIRKAKGRTLWKSSFCCTILSLCKNVYLARKTSGRIIITFIVLILGNLFLVVSMDGFGLFLALVADSLLLLYMVRENAGRQVIQDGLARIASGDLDFKIDTRNLPGSTREMAEAVNHVGDGLQSAVKETLKSERLKADLITNVSHDIKTPLTSIINYVDLLKRADIQDPDVQGYIKVLDSKSQRLKQLTEDLVEASKISSGNVVLDMQPIRLDELIRQTNGEFAEKFAARDLKLVCRMSEDAVLIKADGRRMWRVVENLYNNIAKYAMPGSRVYVDLQKIGCRVIFVVKNISEYPLNIKAEELTERFIRGDVSRSTEGSGLGLSIAQNLVVLQKGTFDIYLDGDLFKVTITFSALERSNVRAVKEQE